MNNTEKKLDALIDALGFDVDEVVRSDMIISANKEFLKLHPSGLTITNIDYKLTKRVEHPLKSLGDCVPLEVQSDAWSSIVEYITNHAGDIEAGTNDFGYLLPAWEFMNRNCK